MKKIAVLGAVSLLAASVYAACGTYDPFVVHEWGTFTTMQGTSGGALEGLQHETERLPPFVHSRTESVASPFRAFGDTSFDEVQPAGSTIGVIAQRAESEVPAHETCRGLVVGEARERCCAQRRLAGIYGKMETPILYFYSETTRTVRVQVDFVGGLLTQWWPRESAASPEFLRPDPLGSTVPPLRKPIDLERIDRSSLEWVLDLIPFGEPLPASIPSVGEKDSWDFARDVRAASVRTQAASTDEDTVGSVVRPVPAEEAERYVFYRGLGAMPQAVEVLAERGVSIVRSTSAEEIPSAFLLDMGQTDGQVTALGALPAGAVRAVPMGGQRTPRPELVARLEQDVLAVLIAQGLYQDEARAMVRTWSDTWFAAEGVRVIYVFPRAGIDALIPLAIEPVPDELVRVMVGRLEFLTPDAEDRIAGALRLSLSDPAAWSTLARQGRFLEPAVRWVMSRTSDPEVRRGGQALLRTYSE